MFNVQSPRTDDAGIEQLIQTKGKTAPRVTPADIEASIASEHYFTAAQGLVGVAVCAEDYDSTPKLTTNSPLHLLTFCVLVLKNGFTVTGESACASPENFDAEIGRRVARANAVNKIWPLLGYELKTKLSRSDSPRQYVAADVLKVRTQTDPRSMRVEFVASMSDGTTIKGSISEEEATTDLRTATAAILKACNQELKTRLSTT